VQELVEAYSLQAPPSPRPTDATRAIVSRVEEKIDTCDTGLTSVLIRDVKANFSDFSERDEYAKTSTE